MLVNVCSLVAKSREGTHTEMVLVGLCTVKPRKPGMFRHVATAS